MVGEYSYFFFCFNSRYRCRLLYSLVLFPVFRSSIQASVMSSTAKTKSKAIIRMEKAKIYFVLNAFTSKVPIMMVLKAMGMETDQEVVQMLGRDPQYATLLLPSIEVNHQPTINLCRYSVAQNRYAIFFLMLIALLEDFNQVTNIVN
ncbi:putative DNA-directed RNA polymerase [Helianthus anomalus]